jgi:hypothetical protein
MESLNIWSRPAIRKTIQDARQERTSKRKSQKKCFKIPRVFGNFVRPNYSHFDLFDMYKARTAFAPSTGRPAHQNAIAAI